MLGESRQPDHMEGADVTSPIVGRLEEPQDWWSAGAHLLDMLVCGVPPGWDLGAIFTFSSTLSLWALSWSSDLRSE